MAINSNNYILLNINGVITRIEKGENTRDFFEEIADLNRP